MLLSLEQGERAFIGFTSATGNAYETHEILAWSFCTLSREIYSEVKYNVDEEFENPIVTENSKLIIVSNKSCSTDIEIFDLLGRKIYKITMWLNAGKNIIENWEYFNLLSKGLYIIVLKSENGIVFKKMIIK